MTDISDVLEPLVPTSALGLRTLMFTSRGPGAPASIRFNPELDMLDVIIGTVTESDLVAVHYLDDEKHLALLVRASDLDIVGLHIEDFVHGLLGR